MQDCQREFATVWLVLTALDNDTDDGISSCDHADRRCFARCTSIRASRGRSPPELILLLLENGTTYYNSFTCSLRFVGREVHVCT